MFSRKIFMSAMILSILTCPKLSEAGALVSGQYQGFGGNEVRVELNIGKPAPASIILIQNLPRGVKVTASNPALKKYSPAKGKAKWLLSKVSPGKLIVSLTLDRSIGKGEISGELRYRDGSGEMITTPLSN